MTLSSPHIVVCGTDTDVGKTVVSSLLVQGLNRIYWKPIQSGLQDGGDRGRVCNLLKLPKDRWLPEAYKFKAAVSPHWAAEQENQQINPTHLKLPVTEGPLIIETAGGLMVPLNRQFLQIDQLKEWMLPVVLVARSTLGTLNHTLLSVEALKMRKIPILGLIINGPYHADNPKTLEQLSGIPIIAELPSFKEVSAKKLSEEWLKQKLESRFKGLMQKHSQAI